MHGHVNDLVRAGKPGATHRSTSVTISGSGLDWHDMAAYLQPDGIGKYSFVPGNKIVFNPPGRQFDTVIMMDCSQCPVHPQLAAAFHEYGEEGRRDHRQVRRPAGAVHVLGLQGRAGDDRAARRAVHDRRQRQRRARDPGRTGLRQGDRAAARARALPARQAPSELAGTYLAACTTYAAIRKKSPVGIKYDAGLGAELATFLQTVAADTVKEYYAR